MRRAVIVAGVYVAAAILLTWPLTPEITSRLGALEGAGDPYLNAWTLGWGMQSWLRDPWGTLAGRVFDAPIFFPTPLTLTFTDHQLLQALVAAPLYAATGQLTLVYNVVLLASLAASGIAMHVLARGVTGSTPAAFLAGLAWACWPYRTAHLLHLQLQALYFLPLALWALTRVAAGRRWRDAAWLGAFAGLQAIASVYYGVMTAVALAVAAPVLGWVTGQGRARRYWARVAAAALLAGAIVIPVAIPYLRSQTAQGFGRNLYEAAHHAASLQSYTQVPPDNALYGRSGVLAPRPPAAGERDRQHVEHQMFPGLVLLGLAAWGAASGWRSDQRAVVIMAAALVATGWWLSLGPEGPLGLYRAVARHAVGFEAIRAPARFAVIAVLGLSLLAAVGLSRVALWRDRRTGGASRPGFTFPAIAIAALLLEYTNAPLTFAAPPKTDTEVGRWLRDAPGPGAVAYLPIGLDRENTPTMVEALQHGRPIVNGYSGQRPASYTAIVESLATLPALQGQAMLKELGVRFVVAPERWPAMPEHPSPFVERAAFEDRIIYEVRWTAESEAALAAVTAVVPPPPGSVPFAAGEEATFAVRWVGDLSAGSITLRATAPSADEQERWPAAAWRLEASAQTAEWVSRFFEARDVFTTMVSGDLMPLWHNRVIDEGAREMTRAYVYDAPRRQVRVAPSLEQAASLDSDGMPLASDARDPVGALYYLRSLPLTVGTTVAVPVNDAGRNVTVRVTVEDTEAVGTASGTIDTLRLRLTLEQGLERRSGIGATLWLSSDARRVPVRLNVSAGFGQLRLELMDYRR